MRSERNLPGEGDPRSNSGESLFGWLRQSGRLGQVMAAIDERERRLRVRRSRQKSAVGVLTLVLLVGGGAYYRTTGFPTPGAPITTKVAKVMAPDRQVLPDGSLMELKGDAQVVVSYTEDERRVVLRRGEAHFEVREDAGRVFVVDAGGIEFRAVGTAFAVQLGATRVGMIVTEDVRKRRQRVRRRWRSWTRAAKRKSISMDRVRTCPRCRRCFLRS